VRITKNRDERRHELITVAARLFMSQGYAETGVSDIVRETGVAQGTFYYYFRSKEEVLEAVVHMAVEELEGELRKIVEGTSGTPIDRLRKMLALVFTLFGSKHDLIAFIHTDANALLHHRLMGTTAMMIRKYFVAVVEEGVTKGQFHIVYPQEMVDFFLGGLMGAMHSPVLMQNPVRAKRFRMMAETALSRSLGLKDPK